MDPGFGPGSVFALHMKNRARARARLRVRARRTVTAGAIQNCFGLEPNDPNNPNVPNVPNKPSLPPGLQVFFDRRNAHAGDAQIFQVASFLPPVFFVNHVVNVDDRIDVGGADIGQLSDVAPGNQSVRGVFGQIAAVDVVRT